MGIISIIKKISDRSKQGCGSESGATGQHLRFLDQD
jgi:hypothetical protein